MDDKVNQLAENFFKQYPLRKYKKGQILIFSGDNPGQVFYLVSGQVKQYDVSYKGDEMVVNVYKPSTFFPMSMALNDSPNPFLFEAETDVELRQAPAQEVVKFVQDNPPVAIDLLKRLYRGLDGVLNRLTLLMKGSAVERLMYEVLLNCLRFGRERPNGNCVSQVSEQELAARSGLTRETVSREMSKLSNRGLLTFNNGELVVKNLTEFEETLKNLPED